MTRPKPTWKSLVTVAAMFGVCTLGLPACSGGTPGGGGSGADASGGDGGSGTSGSGAATSPSGGTATGGSDAGGTGGSGSASGGSATGGSGSGGSASGGTGGTGTACGKRTDFLEVYPPNVFFVLDRSESMEGDKIKQAKAGLDQMADAIADDVRVGVSGFPIKSCCCSSRRLLKMGDHSASEIKQAWSDLTAAGGTPTGMALYHVASQNWISDDTDSDDANRPKAVILITDGVPNDAEICPDKAKDAVHQAYQLYQDGGAPDAAKVYVIGFGAEGNTDKLNLLAESGGTDAPGPERFWSAQNAGELASAIKKITNNDLACRYRLDPKAPEGATLRVDIGGEPVTQGGSDGFVFDEKAQEVVLKGAACTKLREAAEDGTTLQIQVGCPGCNKLGESCSTAADCCSGGCQNGTCVEQCRTGSQSCDQDGDCCGNLQCVREGGDLVGACVGQ